MFFLRTIKVVILVLAIVAAGVLWKQTQLSVMSLIHINPAPKVQALVDAERYAEAEEYLNFFWDYDYVRQDPKAQALHAQIDAVRHSPSYQASKLWEGLRDGTSDEDIGKGAAVISDFFVIGDLRDLATQGTHWIHGENVDEVIVSLASIGVVASAAQVVSAAATVGTAGAAAPAEAGSTAVKVGTIILKAARKLGKLPPWLGKTIIKRAKIVKKTKNIDSVTELFSDVYRLGRTRGGLHLLSKTRDAASLKRMAMVASHFGDSTATLYRIGGKTFLKAAGHVGRLGGDSIKLGATYGAKGLSLLDKVGAAKFAKYLARASKIAYKGDLFYLITKFLAALPQWILISLIMLGVTVWMPWKKVLRLPQARTG